jgi:hypothetical protein
MSKVTKNIELNKPISKKWIENWTNISSCRFVLSICLRWWPWRTTKAELIQHNVTLPSESNAAFVRTRSAASSSTTNTPTRSTLTWWWRSGIVVTPAIFSCPRQRRLRITKEGRIQSGDSQTFIHIYFIWWFILYMKMLNIYVNSFQKS